MSNKTFCPFPWIHFSVRTNGDFRVCCQANQGPNRGILKKENGENFNLKQDKIGTHINATLLKEIRKAALNGIRHPECIRCWREEDSLIKSRRITSIWELQNIFNYKKALKCTDKKTGQLDKDFEPFFYDLRFGNTCNLKCRICGPADSNQWYKETMILYSKNYFHDSSGKIFLEEDSSGNIKETNDDYGWHNQDFFWKSLEEKIPHIKYLYLVGGEPLLIDRHYDFLQKCIDLNQANKIILSYNTNLTILNDNIIDLWTNFKKVIVGGSLDSFEKINDYIRFPSKWPQIEKNIFKLDSIISSKIEAWFTTTISILNIYNTPEFFIWLINSNLKHITKLNSLRPCITFHMLHTPSHLNIKVLPIEIKEKIKKHFHDSYLIFDKIIKNPRQKKLTIEALDSMLDFMFKEDLSDDFPKFIKVTKNLDTLREQKLEDFIPDLALLISDYHNKK